MTSVTLRKCLLGNEVKSGQPTKLCELPQGAQIRINGGETGAEWVVDGGRQC